MQSNFLKPTNSLLRKITSEIPVKDIHSKEIQAIIKKMLIIAKGEQGNLKKPIMVGLAAPQIGISKRIILVDLKANGKGNIGNLKVFINPEIILSSSKTNIWYEGCYSIPNICGVVSRPIAIKIRAYDQNGDIWEGKISRYTARIFQHEIDHLNGNFFTDLIKNSNNLHSVNPEEFVVYRNKQAWKNWPKKAPLPIALRKLKQV